MSNRAEFSLFRGVAWCAAMVFVFGMAGRSSGQEPVAYWDFETGFAQVLPSSGGSTAVGGGVGSVSISANAPAVGVGSLSISSGATQPGGHLEFDGALIGGEDAAYSVCLWFKTSDLGGDGGSTERSLILLTADEVQVARLWMRPYGDDGTRILCNWAGAINERHQDREFQRGLDDGSWHHLALVYDSPNSQLSYYLDGELANREQLAENAGAVRAADQLLIGDALARDGASNWDGEVDDVAIYDFALRANQVSALAEGSAVPLALPAAVADPGRPDPVPFTSGSWQFAVIPDTQHYVWRNNADATVLHGMMDWLVSKRDLLDIGFVGTVGDLTPRNNTTLWNRVRAVFDRLDGELPYVLCLGNHDTGLNGVAGDRDYMPVNDYFHLTDNSRIDPATGGTFREAFETGADGDPRFESTFHEFLAPDGGEFLIFSLEFAPRQAVVDWAAAVCERPEYRDHSAILLVHSYVYEEDSLYRWPEKGDANGIHAGNVHTTGLASPDHDVHDGTELWNELVKLHPQFRMVFCGSVSGSDGTGYVAERNIFGDLVHQMLFDPEWRYRGGNGFMRLIEMLPGGRRAQVRSFSPYIEGQGLFPWITTEDCQFELELDPVFSTYSGWAAEFGLLTSDLPEEDRDEDGLPNLAEFGLVTDPLAGDVQPAFLENQGGLRLVFPFRRQASLFGLSFEVQTNSGLASGDWTPVGGVATPLTEGESVNYRALDPHAEWFAMDLPPTGDSSFYRIEISELAP